VTYQSTAPKPVALVADTMVVFVVYRHDRYSDPGISVHRTRDGADEVIEEFKERYADNGYAWTEENYGRPKWVRYVASGGGEGPNARIEEIKVTR
jgi:hypothetical protein